MFVVDVVVLVCGMFQSLTESPSKACSCGDGVTVDNCDPEDNCDLLFTGSFSVENYLSRDPFFFLKQIDLGEGPQMFAVSSEVLQGIASTLASAGFFFFFSSFFLLLIPQTKQTNKQTNKQTRNYWVVCWCCLCSCTIFKTFSGIFSFFLFFFFEFPLT